MTNEQRETIDRLERYLIANKINLYTTVRTDDLDTVLFLIKEHEEEIERLKTDNGNVWQLNANMSKRHLEDICKLKQKDKQIEELQDTLKTILCTFKNNPIGISAVEIRNEKQETIYKENKMDKFKGYELVILMAIEKIKDGNIFKCLDTKDIYKYDINHGLIRIDGNGTEKDFIDSIYSPAIWLNFNFTILNDKNVTIQNIEEMQYEDFYRDKCVDKINELIKAVKQLDEKVNKEYCANCGVELDEDNRALPNMCNECKYGID